MSKEEETTNGSNPKIGDELTAAEKKARKADAKAIAEMKKRQEELEKELVGAKEAESESLAAFVDKWGTGPFDLSSFGLGSHVTISNKKGTYFLKQYQKRNVDKV